MEKVSLLVDEYYCSGCHTCEVACKQEHGLGVGPRLIRVIEEAPYFKPLFCHHCEDPLCAKACPEDAIVKNPETGVVLPPDGDKCTGCNAVEGESGPEKLGISPCKSECPAHIDVQGFVNLAAKGKFKEALELIKEANPFPAICGRVCPHPCETACNRGAIDEAVSNRSIERYLADWDLNASKRYLPQIKDKKNEKVAIIGSGPAGLSCAYYLAREGYQITVFEKDSIPGGMLSFGIPSYRLPQDVVDLEIQLIRDMGVTIKTNMEIGKDTTIAKLREQGYIAIFTAIGTQECLKLGLEGEDLEGVYSGLDYLRLVNRGEGASLGNKVAVVGGGNTAIDAARTARRLGAENVFILYRRGMEEMPANAEEIEECKEEGISINTLTQPVRLIGQDGRIKAIECIKMQLSETDASGRRKPESVSGSEFSIEVDAMINALGQEADWSCLTPDCACTLTNWKTMKVDLLTLQSEEPDVFAGGDAARGPRTVVEAIADGKRAGISINRYLQGRDLHMNRYTNLSIITNTQTKSYNENARVKPSTLDSQRRVQNFQEVQQIQTEGEIIEEAKRCISCGSSCVQACPYGVMQFNPDTLKAVKCDICTEKRKNNEAPACFNACPMRCIIWGDPEKISTDNISTI